MRARRPLRRSWVPGAAIATILAVGGAPGRLAGQTIDPVELIQRVQQQDTAPGEQVRFVMQLITKSGQVRERAGTIYEHQLSASAVDEARLIRYDSPADLAGSGVLTIEHGDREHDQWLYLPAYHTTRRIAPANRGDRYMGSDFLYEDIMREKIEEYRYDVVGREALNGTPCVILEATATGARLARETAYGKKRMWIDPARDLIVRVDYFNRDGTMFKRLTATETERVGQKHRWREVRMEDFAQEHTTVMKYADRAFGPIPERFFTEQYLKRGR